MQEGGQARGEAARGGSNAGAAARKTGRELTPMRGWGGASQNGGKGRQQENGEGKAAAPGGKARARRGAWVGRRHETPVAIAPAAPRSFAAGK